MFCTKGKKLQTAKYKATRPKRKRGERLNVTISPSFECRLTIWLGLDTHKIKLFSEFPFPVGQVTISIVKND
jgi:hypothetical protein